MLKGFFNVPNPQNEPVLNYGPRSVERAALKAAGEWQALDELPKNSSKVRLKNRCQLTGRPKGYIRYFGLSRVTFREMALNGKIPGVRKASW